MIPSTAANLAAEIVKADTTPAGCCWSASGRFWRHHGFAICSKHGLEFQTVERELSDRQAVLQWMDKNQRAWRNLSPDAFKMSLGRIYNRTKKANGQRGPEKLGQIGPAFLSTAAKLAAEHSVSEATVKRAWRRLCQRKSYRSK